MATRALETRRGFLSGLLIVAGGATAAALSSVGCSAPSPSTEPVAGAGATEVLPLSPGLRYANLMPDHVAAVRRRPTAPPVLDWSTSKGLQ